MFLNLRKKVNKKGLFRKVFMMTYESVENRVRQNCRKLKIAITPNCRKLKIQGRQKCRKLI